MNLWKRSKNKNGGRRLLAAAMAAVLAAGALAGCSIGGPGGNRADSSQTDTGGKTGGTDEKNGTGGTGNAGTAAKGRFLESEIPLPEEVQDMRLISAYQRPDQSMVFYLYDGTSGFCSYFYDGADWMKNEAIPVLPDGIAMEHVFEGRDGKRYAGGHGEGYLYHLFEAPETGAASEVFAEVFQVPEGKDYGPMPDYMNVLGNGNLLMSEYSGAGVYAPDGKKLVSMSQEFIGSQIRASAYAGEDYYLTLADGSGRLVRYHTETGEENGSFEVPEKNTESRMNMMLFADAENGIYAAGPSGLYHTQKDGTLWEQVIDGTLNSMSRQDLTVRSFSRGGDGSYYGVYTQTDGGRVVFLRYAFDENVDAVPPETVSVYSLRDNKLVRHAAAVLQKNNPRLRVDFQFAAYAEDEAVTEDIIRALNTELLNGKGADVLILDGLPAENYRDKGILADMTGLAGTLKPELLSNVAEAFDTADGKTYYLPARLMVPVVYGEQAAVEARLSLGKMKAYEGTPTLFSPDNYENLLRQTAYTCYGELFDKDGAIDETALKTYLEAVRSAGEKANAKTAYTEAEMTTFDVDNRVWPDGFGRQGAYGLVLENCAAAAEMLASIDSASLSFAAAKQKGVALQDAGGIYIPATLAGINAAGANQAGAEEFLRTLFSSEVQDQSLWSGFPVRSDSLEKWKSMEKDSVIVISSSLNDVELEGEWPAPEQREELIELIKKLRTPVIADQSVMQIIVDGSKNYLDGKEPVEGAVSAIENKIRLYRAERE